MNLSLMCLNCEPLSRRGHRLLAVTELRLTACRYRKDNPPLG